MGLIEDIKKNMIGRIATDDEELRLLAQMIDTFCDGNHLEIGVLHGGTMVLAGKLIGGAVIGIDPFDGYYMDNEDKACAVDPITKVPVTPAVCMRNLDSFGINNYMLCCVKSDPFPIEGEFDTAFIDGDHWGNTPYKDWLNVSKRTKRAIMLDNCDPEHPDVEYVLNHADGWKVWKQSKKGVVLVKEDE
jgi:hypothetical protein